MSTVSTLITDINYGIEDVDNTRFTSTYKLGLIKIAIRRTNSILQRNGIQFAKKYTDLTTTDDQAYVDMPADFDVDIGLYKTALYEPLTKCLEGDWEQLQGMDINQFYMLDYVNSRILLKDTPNDSTTTLRLWYYPTVDPSAYTVDSTMPWGGRVDDAIVQYVVMRLLNIGEMDVSSELSLMTDLENQILQKYQPLAQTMISKTGWVY
jgi:hypothetical protein